MTAHEILEIMDLNSEIIGNIMFIKNEYQITFARFVLLYVSNVELAGIDFSREKNDGIQNRHFWYLWK